MAIDITFDQRKYRDYKISINIFIFRHALYMKQKFLNKKAKRDILYIHIYLMLLTYPVDRQGRFNITKAYYHIELTK